MYGSSAPIRCGPRFVRRRFIASCVASQVSRSTSAGTAIVNHSSLARHFLFVSRRP